MNPSSAGWINKHLQFLRQNPATLYLSESEFYSKLLNTGFIYGVSVTTLTYENEELLKWTELERAKINLLDALLYTFAQNGGSPEDFIKTVVEFYFELSEKEFHFLTLSIRRKPTASTLEKIIQERTRTNEHLIEKNFSHLITNALLFLDILSFDRYLKNRESPREYAAFLEALIMNTVWLALTKKEDKGNYDKLLLKLFQKSLRYTRKLLQEVQTLEDLPFDRLNKLTEKRYLLDLAALTIWEDQKVDSQEYEFLRDLDLKLGLSELAVTNTTGFVNEFMVKNKNRISYLDYSNPVKHFYNHTSRTVRLLILRNKNRLLKELSQSKELVILLRQSTIRELDKQERKQVKMQLLDICKSIPSLAIFMLPGGGILLPLLIKFIPEMLPSAFNENRLNPDQLPEKNRN